MTAYLAGKERAAEMPTRKVLIASPGGTAAFSGGIGIVSRLIEEGFDEHSRFRARVFDPRGAGSAILWPLFFMRAAAQLTWAAWRGKVDIIHLQVSERSSFIRKGLLMALSRLLGLTVVLHHHGAELISTYGNGAAPLRWIMRRTILGADMNIVLGGSWQRFLIDQVGAAPERVHILRNATIDWSATSGRPEAGRKRLLLLANLSPRKGVGEFLEALALLRGRGHDIEATLAGGGDVEGYREQARRLGLGGHCHFMGWVGREQIGPLFSDALALVLPSHDEGLPMAILEALSARVPVVATPVGSIPEVLTNGETYRMVPPRNAIALAGALEEIIQDPALRARLAEGGRALYEHQFEAGAYLNRLASIYSAAERTSGMPPEPCPRHRAS